MFLILKAADGFVISLKKNILIIMSVIGKEKGGGVIRKDVKVVTQTIQTQLDFKAPTYFCFSYYGVML